MRISLIWLSFFMAASLLSVKSVKAQVSSCCDTAAVITLCYLSGQEYCLSPANSCPEYAIDGNFLQNGLVQKLLSPINFGPSGTVDCEIELFRLEDVSSSQAITDAGCDIIFIPNSFMSPNNQLDLLNTYIPDAVFESIYEWSTECPQNLVVATQGEATYWGYVLENANFNPNTAAPGPVPLDIFNGPFGSLTQFSQGGSFQGVFTDVPPTGTIILANDALGRPTVCLDIATNDIMLGDIGIFCSQGAGPVSFGPGINNNNDILACNIFALACEIAAVSPITVQNFLICPQDLVLLPDGSLVNVPGLYLDTLLNSFGCDSVVASVIELKEIPNTLRTFEICPFEPVELADGSLVSTPGIYIDSLTNTQGCDSVIITEIMLKVIPPTLFSYDGCEGDNYSILINGMDYSESNPQGSEILTSNTGCDSILNINLVFKPHASGQESLVYCPGESYLSSSGQSFNQTGIYFDTLTAFNGCDSVVTINLDYLENSEGSTAVSLCVGDVYALSNGQQIFQSGQYIDTLSNVNGCDSLLQIDLLFKSDSTFLQRDICGGDQIQINGQFYGIGDTYQEVTPNTEGCDSLLFTTLVEVADPLVVIPPNVVVESGQVAPFKNTIPLFYLIDWTPEDGLSCADCPNPSIDSREALDRYTITLTDTLGCIWDYEVAMEYICHFYIPNIFSPNNDGINDDFRMLGSACRLEAFEMKIYDRWGGLLFTSQDERFGWDGTSEGKRLDPGVYTYTIKYLAYGQSRQIAGELTLIR
jgi:gliding motility-associated-like protein